MQKKAIDRFTRELVQIAKHATTSHGVSGHDTFRLSDGATYSLPNEEARKLIGLISWFMREGNYAEVFTEDYVAEKIKKLLADMLAGRVKDAASKAEALCAELEAYNAKQTIYLCVDGLVLDTPFSIGRVKLAMCTEEFLSKILDDILKLIGKTKGSQEKKKSLYNVVSSEISKELLWSCIAEVSVVAEPSRAYERAKEEVRRVIDIFRFASKAIYPIHEDIRIGLRGDNPKPQITGFVFGPAGYYSKKDTVGAIKPFEINKETLRRMGEIGAIDLGDFLIEDAPSDFKERLLRATHWLSSAIIQPEVENAMLHLLFALETLFTADRENPDSDAVAEAAAVLIVDTLVPRRNVKSMIKDYYSVRRGMAHGGRKTFGTGELHSLINIVGTVIMALVGNCGELETQKDVMRFIDDIKLS